MEVHRENQQPQGQVISFRTMEPDKDENIEVLTMFKDRIMIDAFFYKPIKKSKILNPHTNEPMETPDAFDRHNKRGKIVFLSNDLKESCPELKEGVYVMFESQNACSPIFINGKAYLLTRLSNIILAYKSKGEEELKEEKVNKQAKAGKN